MLRARELLLGGWVDEKRIGRSKMLPMMDLNEWSKAIAYERLTEARERRLALEARAPHRWPDLRGWLACQLLKAGYRLDRRVCRRAAAVCGSR